MNDENWKEEFKRWKLDLKPFQIKLLDEGAHSQSQTLMLNDMWCEWKKLATTKKLNKNAGKSLLIADPWEEKQQEETRRDQEERETKDNTMCTRYVLRGARHRLRNRRRPGRTCPAGNEDTTCGRHAHRQRSLIPHELRTHGKPQFGTSKHLAEMLLEARNIDSSKCAIINIRPPGDYEGTDIDAVQEACNQLGWSLADADRNGLEHTESEVDVILDIGDFGWEPSLYVLGQSPLEVVDRCHTLVKTLEGMS